jgi:poly(A) polymerase
MNYSLTLEIQDGLIGLKIEQEALNILEQIDKFLGENRIEAYLVGGFVRDSLIGRFTADIDITVTGDAIKIASQAAVVLGGKHVLLDEVNRVARVVFISPPQTGIKKQWYVDFSTISETIERDLARRDFTVDAMAIYLRSWVKNPENIKLIDPFGGQADLKQKVIRVVDEKAFEADPARLLRAVRLAAELEFKVSAETEILIKKSKTLIQLVAGERVREELLRIFACPAAGYFVRYLDELGLLTSIIPELESSRGVVQPIEHHWDVLNHSLETVNTAGFILRQGECDYADPKLLNDLLWNEKIERHFSQEVSSGSTRETLFKLAALLHDIAKPETRIISNERVRFFGHNEQGADAAAVVMERLRFSHKEIKLVEEMVRYHMRPTQLSNEGMPSQKAIFRFFRDCGETGIDVLFLSLADHLAARGPGLIPLQWNWHVQLVNYVIAEYFRQKNVIIPSKLLDGNDLMLQFNLKPGPEIRKILVAVQEARVTGEIKTREEALSYVKNRLLYREQKLEE